MSGRGTPYYEHGDITIYHGDCREILPDLKASTMLTDPPFGIRFGNATWSDDPAEYPEFVRWLVSAANEAISGWCFVFQSGTNVARFHEWFPSGWRVFAACKDFAQMRATEVQYSWDPVVFWKNSDIEKKHRTNAGIVTRDFHVGAVAGELSNRVGHPSPRPLNTMRHLVLLASAEGDTILDPFAGSGTTLVAARDEGRKAIGIEIEERYCEIAAKRLAQEVLRFETEEEKASTVPAPPAIEETE